MAWRRWDRAYRSLFDAEIRWLESGAPEDEARAKLTGQWVALLDRFAGLFTEELEWAERAQGRHDDLKSRLHRMANDEDYLAALIREANQLDQQK